MNEIEFQKLMEESWRRKLAPPEEAALKTYLATHFDARALWEEESGLNQSLAKLPDIPVSTNFTSRVLQAVERDLAHAARSEGGIVPWLKLNWLPRVAIVSLFAYAGFISVQQYSTAKRTEMARTEIARDVAAVSSAAAFPQEWLRDFDAINRLSQPPVDDELLAALQ